MWFWPLIVHYGLFVESTRKMDIRQFMKEKAFLIAEV